MGWGDERGNIDPKYVAAAEVLAETLYPDLDVIPGGEAARDAYVQARTAAKNQGARILRLLESHGMIDLGQITETSFVAHIVE